VELLTLPDNSGEKELGNLLESIRRYDPDLVFDLHASLRSRVLTARLGCPVKRVCKRYLRRWTIVSLKSGLKLPWVVDRYLELLPGSPRGELPRWHGELVSVSEPGLRVSLVPGSGFFTKSWPEEYWREMLSLAREWPVQWQIHGGPAEVELGGKLAAVAPERISVHCGVSLAETASLMASAQMVVTGDTGLMHLAVALRRPVLLLAGGTTAALGFFPPWEGLTVLQVADLSCRPCSHMGKDRCPRKHFACMRKLSPQMVLSQLARMLKHEEWMQ
jgi:ADP-heptose:LPS heptosyltransferase